MILDESTSAMDVASEERMYRLLKSLQNSTFISVGHRPTLFSFHDLKFNFQTATIRSDASSSSEFL